MILKVSRVFAALFLLLAAHGQAAAATAMPETLLDALRRATLARPIASISSLDSWGKVEVVGLQGSEQEWDDLRNGQFAGSLNAGALTGANGWDGQVAWSRDYAGLVTIDGGTAGRLQAIDQAYLDTFGYLQPRAGGATVVYAGPRTDHGTTYDVLAVTPPRGSEVDLWLDRSSHLIARETSTIGIISTTTTLSNYRRVHGVTFPFFVSTVSSTGNATTIRLSGLRLNENVATKMHVPRQDVRDISIAGGSETSVPLEIINNHIYLDVMLDGHGPYRFVLDSGGDYIVTPEVAAALGVKSAGSAQIGGVGNATESVAFTKVRSIGVGSAVILNQYMLVLPIATGFGMAEGLRIDGMLGYQFLARFSTTIDYAGSKMTLSLPSSTPAAAPGAAAIPFFIDGTIPRIAVSVDGVPASAEVDTGNRAALELSAPFLAGHPAIAAFAKTSPGVVGFGVGGPAFARLGRVPSLQIGPYQLTDCVTSFTYQSQGAFADPYNPANIGGTIWRRFDVTFDYAHHQMLLAKGAEFATPPTYDRSGLFLIDRDNAYTVLSTFPGTPAVVAGLAKGDVIVTIDGAPASNLSLAQLRALLSGPAGTVVRLGVRTKGAQRVVTLKLADYV